MQVPTSSGGMPSLLLAGIQTFVLWFQQPSKIVIDVPTSTVPLGYSYLDDNLRRRFAQCHSVEPNSETQQLSDLFVGNLVPLFIRYALVGSPYGLRAWLTACVLLKRASTFRQQWHVRAITNNHSLESIKGV